VESSQIDSESLANKLLLAVAGPAVAAAVELRERRYFPTAITRLANRWGLTTSGESVEPNGTQLTLPHAVMLRRGREHRPQYCVAVLTNAIRKQVPEFWRVIRACQDNATRMTHSLIDDIYAYLHVTRACEMDAIDILLHTVIPFVENGLGEPMKGSLQTRERQVLRDWAATAARKMTESHDKFRRNLPAGVQLGYLVHAARGFQFMLDFAWLADRHLPQRLAQASPTRVCRLGRAVFETFTAAPHMPAEDRKL
jgi:hypothetical protein